MPDYGKLRELVSHRLVFEYDTGARVIGYLAACKPGEGPVQVANLSHVELRDADGELLESHDKLSICPNALVGFHLQEGPSGRDIR
jgi:hypothetical protein